MNYLRLGSLVNCRLLFITIKKITMTEKRTIISLPLDLHTDLKKYAASNRLSMKDVIIEAVEAAIYQHA